MTFAFHLGPIPVRIHLWFLITALLLGLGAQHGPVAVAVWGGGFFLTVFAHELAHAVAARWFGAPAEVHLTLFRAGLASRIGSLSPLQRVAVWLAGPALSLLIAAMSFAVLQVRPAAIEMGAGVLRYLGWINVGWGFLNLMSGRRASSVVPRRPNALPRSGAASPAELNEL
jgi:hypothetical protein